MPQERCRTCLCDFTLVAVKVHRERNLEREHAREECVCKCVGLSMWDYVLIKFVFYCGICLYSYVIVDHVLLLFIFDGLVHMTVGLSVYINIESLNYSLLLFIFDPHTHLSVES